MTLNKQIKPSSTLEPAEVIVKNWELFCQLAKLCTREHISDLLSSKDFEERIMTAPASTKLEFVCAYPGGLVEHSLRVLSLMFKLNKVYNQSYTTDELVFVSLFHDLGKVGTERFDYYKDCESDWHRTKLGQMYELNPKISYLPVTLLTSKLLELHHITSSYEESYTMSTIKSSTKQGYVDEQITTGNEPMLAVMLQQAVKVALLDGKNRQSPSIIKVEI